MAFKVASLWQAPTINPVNNKAQSIPIFNPFNIYGRVFLLSWWSFFIAFWSWYAFPPLLTVSIKKDIHLSQNEIANSNIVALTATFIVRLTAGAACDRFGPRWTFAAILLAGAIPTALAGTVNSATGLIILRFFVGILGGAFVPCQVWTTGFFDKNVVGTANALTAGLGNAGSGVTYFVMPAIFDSLVQRQHLTPHSAWRVAFVVPFILIVASALVIIVACPDAPTGKWSSRAYDMQRQAEHRDIYVSTFDNEDRQLHSRSQGRKSPHKHNISDHSVELEYFPGRKQEQEETALNEQDLLNAASWELVEKPTYHGSVKAIISLPTLTLFVAYFCTFGTELAVNSFLGAFYLKTFPHLGQTGSGRWAAMYGLLNAVFRPLGGLMADIIYRTTGSLWGKKILMHSLAIIMGVFMLIIGFVNPHHKATMMGLMTGLAFFEEAGNGSVFALLPHVHPTSNGLITGVTGAAGNLGGIVYLLIARYNGTNYARVFWIVGIVNISASLLVTWIRPLPKRRVDVR
ncbi:MFS transporter, NNP family, nitrate/nitrite transporter, partial [Lecanoromycetidae sp. Uapishka_2]